VTGHIVRRLAQAVIVILLAILAVFVLLHMLPGGPARAILGKHATPAQIALFTQQNHLSEPIIVQFARYVDSVAHLNLGYSYQLNQTVASLLAQRIPKTLVLTILSVVVSVIIAIPMAVVQAARRNRVVDSTFTAVSLVLYATPVFFSGLLLIIVFAVHLNWFPAQAPQATSVWGIFADFQAMILPVLTLALAYLAGFSRYVRSSVLDNLGQDYVRTVRAIGATEKRVLFLHVLRNACLPLITFAGIDLPYFLGGAIVVEVLYNFPGMGLLFWNAAQSEDYPTLLGVTLVISAAVVIGSLIADLLYAVVDPRIRRQS
jgi:peptide/nickel transport system permease protein